MTFGLKVDLKANTNCGTFNYLFECDHGSVTILMGPSASGKSTFLRSIAGLNHNISGVLTQNSTTLFDSKKNINVPAFNRKIGFVFQTPVVFPFLSVMRNLLFPIKFSKKINPNFHPEQIMEKLGLESVLNKSVATLSGGERQRLALGRTLISGPDILLLDEPMSALDQKSKIQIINYLNELGSKRLTTIIYVTHSATEANMIHGKNIDIEEIRSVS